MFIPLSLFTISVLCFIIYRELHKSVKCFITKNSYCIRAVSLDKLHIKSVIINSREIKLDKAFFRNNRFCKKRLQKKINKRSRKVYGCKKCLKT